MKLDTVLGILNHFRGNLFFKIRVLEEAQQRLLSKTDISFTYEEQKIGKKVVSLIFHLSNNKDKPKELPQTIGLEQSNISPNNEDQEHLVLELTPIVVKEFGVSLKVFMALAEAHTEGEIRQAIEITQKTMATRKIDNVAGFFVEAVRGKYTDAKQKKKQIDSAQKAKIAETKRVEVGAEQQIKEQKQVAYEKELRIFSQLIAEDKDFIPALTDKVCSGMFGSYYKKDKTFEDNLNNPMLKATFLNVAKELKPERFV